MMNGQTGKATSKGFRLEPGIKEIDTDTNFRKDSPLAKLNFNGQNESPAKYKTGVRGEDPNLPGFKGKRTSAQQRSYDKAAKARRDKRLAEAQKKSAEKKRSARKAAGHDVAYANKRFKSQSAEGRAIKRDQDKGLYS